MSTKKVGASLSGAQKSKKNNKKDIVNTIIPLIVVILLICIIYKIIELIVDPTDVFMIVNGTILNQESAIRLCYKR